MFRICLSTILCTLFLTPSSSQVKEMQYIPAEVDFKTKIVDWDGFGFNYVEAAQTRDYAENPQDYGGFSLLTEAKRNEIIDLVFGEDGLQVQLLKMFLDPHHQQAPGQDFDHESSTRHMMEFATKGHRKTMDRGDKLNVITTLYGPPAWATVQKFMGGRDLDQSQSENLCLYLIDWIKFLKTKQLNVKYLSLHNEGEDFYRWNFDDGAQRLLRFDYNMYWPPEQVNDFLKLLPPILKAQGLQDIKLTNGEPSNWTRFYHWNYANGLADDKEALNHLGLLTTHGFINGNMGKLSYSTANPLTTDLLRSKRPELHAWVTSFSWGEMGVDFVRMVHENIYSAKINGIIPWAGLQDPDAWIDGDLNLGTAFVVNKDGTYEITRGYYFYKQLTRAGYRGMHVVRTYVSNPQATLIGFAGAETRHPDAFVLTSNIFVWSLPIEVELKGSRFRKFQAYRTTENGEERYKDIGIFEVKNGSIIYDPPQGSTTTFIGVE